MRNWAMCSATSRSWVHRSCRSTASAALFFGSLVPIFVKYESRLLLPLAYGLGTALPVILFALAIVAGAVARAFQQVATFERWARIGTGIIFAGVGA